METKYRILKDHGLMVQKIKGVFDFGEFIAYTKIIMQDPDWKYVDKIVTDLKNAELSGFFEKMDEYLNYKKTEIKRSYSNVFIVDNPLNTAVVDIFKNKHKSLSDKYEYCSTLNFALSFLDMSYIYDEVSEVLDEL